MEHNFWTLYILIPVIRHSKKCSTELEIWFSYSFMIMRPSQFSLDRYKTWYIFNRSENEWFLCRKFQFSMYNVCKGTSIMLKSVMFWVCLNCNVLKFWFTCIGKLIRKMYNNYFLFPFYYKIFKFLHDVQVGHDWYFHSPTNQSFTIGLFLECLISCSNFYNEIYHYIKLLWHIYC